MVHHINQSDRHDNSFDNALQSMRVDGGSRALPNKFSLVATRNVHHGLNGFISYSGRTRDVRGVLYIRRWSCRRRSFLICLLLIRVLTE